jgi:hypothetical protein
MSLSRTNPSLRSGFSFGIMTSVSGRDPTANPSNEGRIGEEKTEFGFEFQTVENRVDEDFCSAEDGRNASPDVVANTRATLGINVPQTEERGLARIR